MMKDVIISIKSSHGYDGDRDGDNAVEFTTDGLYSLDEGVPCLSYLESEVTGLEGTRTSVLVMPQQVVVDRDGLITSRMVFQEGKKTSFQYSTPYGMATMGVSTKKISKSFDENGGRMELDFVVDMEHTMVSRSKFSVTVREQSRGGYANV